MTLAEKCKGSSTGWPRSCGGRSSSPTAETSSEQAQPHSRNVPRTSPVSSPSSLPRDSTGSEFLNRWLCGFAQPLKAIPCKLLGQRNHYRSFTKVPSRNNFAPHRLAQVGWKRMQICHRAKILPLTVLAGCTAPEALAKELPRDPEQT